MAGRATSERAPALAPAGDSEPEIEVQIHSDEWLTATPVRRHRRSEAARARVGPFQLIRELARGGMASVHEARLDPSVPRGDAPEPERFAIKLVLPELASESSFIEMFLDEARIASQIRHPAVCRVIRFGEIDDTLFATMELLRGVTLRRLARAIAARPEDLHHPAWARVSVRVMLDVCAGLAASHAACDEAGAPLGVVHRDVSPQNVIVCWTGRAKVIDFGIARANRRLHATRAGVVKGKFSYIAPEQIVGPAVDPRADVWSAGVVLWELLAGRPLFRRSSDAETIAAVLAGDVPILPGAPAGLQRVIEGAVCADLDRRLPSAGALHDRLAEWLDAAGGCEAEEVAAWLARACPGQRALDAIAPGGAEGWPGEGAPAEPAEASALPRAAERSGSRHRASSLLPMLVLAVAIAAAVFALGRTLLALEAGGSAPRSPSSLSQEVP